MHWKHTLVWKTFYTVCFVCGLQHGPLSLLMLAKGFVLFML